MQNSTKTGFEPVPSDLARKIDALEPKYRTLKAVKEIIQTAPRPTLTVGEIVEFSGMKFRVLRIKADGKVGLKMVP